jgi:hypothetical protein
MDLTRLQNILHIGTEQSYQPSTVHPARAEQDIYVTNSTLGLLTALLAKLNS